MKLDSRFTWSVVYELCSRYGVEVSGGYHEVADSFTKVAELNLDVLEEGISGPLPNDHDCFWVYSC